MLHYLAQPQVLTQMAIWILVVSGAAAAIAWTGNPPYFRTFRGRWLCLVLPSVPLLLWHWVLVADSCRALSP